MITHLAVCGLGKLGSPMAVSFARRGLQVIAYDLDREKVDAINRLIPPVQEPGLAEALYESAGWLKATTDPAEAVRESQACIFVTPTPSLPDGSFDNQYLLAAIEKIAPALQVERRATPYFFIIASTVTPGSCEKILLPAIRRHSDNIRLIYKPEFIALGTVMHDLAQPDAILFGGEPEISLKTVMDVLDLYSRLQRVPGNFMTWTEAELAKISLNCAITMKISFANQVGMVAMKLGADPRVILDFIGRDSRIGPKALRFGMPYGGACFPRDNRMFQHVADKAGIVPYLATATDLVNDELFWFILAQIPADGDIGILGLSYKAGTPVTEQSAGIALKQELLAKGRTVKAHDPLLAPDGLAEVLKCRTIIVTTDCPEYRKLLYFEKETFLIDPMGVVALQSEPR
jgi:UDPglucose 6-dehydrogenase